MWQATVPEQMRQAFFSLIGNSIKFARVDAPLTIDIRGDMMDTPSGEDQDGRSYCRITISDNGIGFEQEHAEQIFGMFKSLHPKGRYEGTGIGLAITKKIIERHHGKITAEATPGKGAAFAVVLPLRQNSLRDSSLELSSYALDGLQHDLKIGGSSESTEPNG